MRQLTRLPQPNDLENNWKKWGEKYSKNKSLSNSHVFQWRTINGVKINSKLIPILLKMSDNHCHYCDKFPLGEGDLTIDHFCPKSLPEFYTIAYKWENLFLSCNHCQMCKMENFDPVLLRPDDQNYKFQKYFIYNYSTHKLEPNPQLSPFESVNAQKTIEIFNFNHPSMQTMRRHAYERFQNDSIKNLLDYPFRFIFE
ncbi:HNH endonuclease [Lacihabitans soyangensis]|uniref:HNH domain-containing protein n=1 Tax=Lacihabitans soyangensis TaxID=869394 RepID=A0AAE3H3F9_9BACT|nr:HNH endonuclease [Lacihabitans soyangensis]MCP9763304.1 hypothetical protein [Lacihabitans soyangensis]